MSRAARPGVVLLLALLCLLALEVTAVGLHFIARQELRTAAAAARDTELRIAAQSAAARAIDAWPADLLAAVVIGGSLALNGIATRSATGIVSGASIERIDTTLFLVRAHASSPLLETVRLGLLVAATTAEDLARPLTTAVRTNGAIRLATGSIIAHGSDVCADAAGAIELRSEADIHDDGGTIVGAVIVSPAPVVDRISTLDWRVLESISAATGDIPVTFHEGDMVITSTAGQGILLVVGNLTFRGGQFDGIVLVRGSLTLLDGARLNGAVLVDGGDISLETGTIRFDGCTIRNALANPWLLGPFRTGRRLWIPLF